MKFFSSIILLLITLSSTIPLEAQVVHPWIIKDDTFEEEKEGKHEEGRVNPEVTK